MSIELRPLAENSGGSCDWGSCDGEPVMERRDSEHGWLPVCARHTGPATGGLYTGPPLLDESGCSLPWPAVISSALPADSILVGDFTEIARAAAERRPVNPKAFALLKLAVPLPDAALDLDPEVADG